MKNLIYRVIVLGAIVISGSCKKSFLDVPVTNEVIANEYMKDLASAGELLNGIYLLTARGVFDGHAVAYADVNADNVKSRDGMPKLGRQYQWSMIASAATGYEENMNNLWLRGYEAIRHCNYLLENIDRLRNEDATVADYLKGQALALRALVHFQLVNVFAQPFSFSSGATHAGIPYDTVYAQNYDWSRASVDEVYANIMADLQKALELTPSSQTSRDVFNPLAIQAILARVYLFKGDMQNANKYAVTVANAAQLMPPNDYPSQLFTPQDNESLFRLKPAEANSGGWTEFAGLYYIQPAYYAATADLADLLNEYNGDKRQAWVGDTVDGSSSYINLIKKFPTGVVPGMTYPLIAYYQTIVRTAEMYLTAAETYAIVGNEDSARYFLNEVRSRAIPGVVPVTSSGTPLLDDIYKERRKELCFENLRFYDLLRLKQGVNRTDFTSPAPATLPFPSNAAIAPIPETDVRLLGLQQNEGYN